MTVTEALTEYEDALQRVDAPVLGWLNPGTTSAELDAAEQQAGFELPEDVRTIWSWRNGSAPPAPPDRMTYFTPGSWFPDLTTAIDRGRSQTEEWLEALGEESGYLGTQLIAFLIPFGLPGVFVIDCEDPRAPDSPAISLGREGLFTEAVRNFSVAETISLWTTWIRIGWWVLNEAGVWTFNAQAAPKGIERFQL